MASDNDHNTRPYRVPTFDMGPPKIDVTKALQIAGELEDAVLASRRQAARSPHAGREPDFANQPYDIARSTDNDEPGEDG